MKKINTLANWLTNGSMKRQNTYHMYLNKYFNLFLGAYKFTGITPEQSEYILRKFWYEGKIGAFIVEGTKLEEGDAPSDTNQYPNGMIAFAPFAPFLFNIYDWPIQVNLVNVRGASFIPTKPLVVNKQVVIGYCQKNKKPVQEMVEYYLQKIVNVEMTIDTQLKAHKVPWLVKTTPDNEEKVKALFKKVEADDGVLYVDANDMDSLETLQGGNQYILDKLYQYKQALENELLTYLGIDNLGIIEKKEHMISDEVNSNNDLINDQSDNFLTCMQEFFAKIKEVFGITISVEAVSSPVNAESSEEDEEERGDEEDEN